MKRISATCLLVLSFTLPCSAETITFNYSTAYSGATPGGNAPWLTAAFSDTGGGVLLTMTAGNLLANEFVTMWGFNLNPTVTLSQPDYRGGQEATRVQTQWDGKNFDGGGYYDIVFYFTTANAGDQFIDNESSTWFFPGLTARDFMYQATGSGGEGVFYTAAHVQGITGGSAPSGWVTDPVPEPLTALLVGTGLTLSSLFHWRRRRSSGRS